MPVPAVQRKTTTMTTHGRPPKPKKKINRAVTFGAEERKSFTPAAKSKGVTFGKSRSTAQVDRQSERQQKIDAMFGKNSVPRGTVRLNFTPLPNDGKKPSFVRGFVITIIRNW